MISTNIIVKQDTWNQVFIQIKSDILAAYGYSGLDGDYRPASNYVSGKLDALKAILERSAA